MPSALTTSENEALQRVGCAGRWVTVIDAGAPLAFASDWPVLELHTPFAAAYDAFRRVCADLPAADQRALFHDTARRIYRL